jgi:hypothetical protein
MYCYLNYIYVEYFFGAGILGLPVWEPDPKILGGHAGAPNTDLPVPLPTTILGAPVKMLLEPFLFVSSSLSHLLLNVVSSGAIA